VNAGCGSVGGYQREVQEINDVIRLQLYHSSMYELIGSANPYVSDLVLLLN